LAVQMVRTIADRVGVKRGRSYAVVRGTGDDFTKPCCSFLNHQALVTTDFSWKRECTSGAGGFPGVDRSPLRATRGTQRYSGDSWLPRCSAGPPQKTCLGVDSSSNRRPSPFCASLAGGEARTVASEDLYFDIVVLDRF